MVLRQILRDNLRAVFKFYGKSIKNPPACTYQSGPKKGKRVSQRTIQHIWDWKPTSAVSAAQRESPAPGLDVIEAISVAFNLPSWHLLFPELSPGNAPALATEREIEAEVNRRMDEERKAAKAERAAFVAEIAALQGRIVELLKAHGPITGGPGGAANRSVDT